MVINAFRNKRHGPGGRTQRLHHSFVFMGAKQLSTGRFRIARARSAKSALSCSKTINGNFARAFAKLKAEVVGFFSTLVSRLNPVQAFA